MDSWLWDLTSHRNKIILAMNKQLSKQKINHNIPVNSSTLLEIDVMSSSTFLMDLLYDPAPYMPKR